MLTFRKFIFETGGCRSGRSALSLGIPNPAAARALDGMGRAVQRRI